MKKDRLFFVLFIGFLWSSCSNDLNLTSEWKDIPVVYGLLNKGDNPHYIRVEKAFLDPDENAFILAREPDSIYYNSIDVFLEKISTGEQFQLERVDGNLEGLPRDEGVFAHEPNYLFKVDSTALDLTGGESIRLLLDRGDNLPQVTAQTVILGDLVLKEPSQTSQPPQKMSFRYELNEDISWSAPDEAEIFDVKLIINYQEFEVSDPGGTFQEKSLDWIWEKGAKRETPGDSRIEVEMSGEEFYLFLKNNLDSNPIYGRFFKNIDIEIVAGGEELATFIEIKNANTGITSSQELPFFTNLSEGRGVFSSRNILRVNGIGVVDRTRDSLRNGIHTIDLNFM